MSNSKLVNVVVPAYPGNYTKGRDGRKIEAITIHHMAGRLSAEQCGQIFQQVGRQASSNYGVGYDGRIGLYVDECNTSWCNSNWDSNCKSVTIETSDNDNSWYVNDTTMKSLIKLVADIAKRNNLGKLVKGKNLTWHSMFANTECPGAYLLSKLDYICDEANKINNETPKDNKVNVYYRVKTVNYGWLPEVKNLNDYAGYNNDRITGIAIKVDKGAIKYRVHIKGGDWLPYVNGYNINDYINGFAGNGQVIDAIEVYYYTPNSIRPFKRAKYKVNDYAWQYDNETSNGQDGYAGAMGVSAKKFQIEIV